MQGEDHPVNASVVRLTPRVNTPVGRSSRKETATHEITQHVAKFLY
jgi:hypothetical protein